VEFETRAIHAGQDPDPHTGAVTTPIYTTSTYAQRAVGESRYDYSRTANPTREAFEACLASLEGAEHGIAFGSGMAATTTVMHLLDPGAHVVAVNDVYGGTYRLFSKVYEPKGYRFTYVTADECNAGLGPKLDGADMLWLETPTNPLLNVVDLRAASEAAHTAGAIVAVDNTFASPYLQRPLEHGADIVVHSTTKYLGGHSDLVGGVTATSDAALAERLRFLQNSLGAIPGPFDAWLALRGLKTLAVRMRAHCANAGRIVEFLQGHPAVDRVLYPGLSDHPGHAIAARQMDEFGGMVSFLAGSEEEALALVARTRIWTLAESLGGVESLIEHPGQMTHASTADSPFAVPSTLVRLSVGIEAADDLIADLDQALTGS
jgi:cystathionine gamma-synthase